MKTKSKYDFVKTKSKYDFVKTKSKGNKNSGNSKSKHKVGSRGGNNIPTPADVSVLELKNDEVETVCAHDVRADKWGTCFDEETLLRIAKAYNTKHPDTKIDLNLSKPKLITEIKSRFEKSCNSHDGLCWINNLSDVLGDKAKKIKEDKFKPERPKGKKDWLSTFDIADVMKQFEKKYKDFVFFGPFPVDFMDVLEEFPFLDLKNLSKKNIHNVGMIFNLDKHNEPGSHWVAYFLDIKSKDPSIEYFDSVGKTPPPQIEKFMSEVLKNAFMTLDLWLNKKINKIQHQRKDTECGVYSLYFVTERLKGRSFEDICSKVIPDDLMNNFRAYYFRPYEGGTLGSRK